MTQTPQPFRTASPGAAIWILEPDPSLGQVFEHHCRHAGWRTTRFASTAAFEMALAEDTPDLLLLNRSLSAQSGLQELRELRQSGHRFAILMLAGPSSPAVRAQGLELGADDYLSTPFLTRELILRIEHLLNCSKGQVMGQLPQPGRSHFQAAPSAEPSRWLPHVDHLRAWPGLPPHRAGHPDGQQQTDNAIAETEDALRLR